MAQEEDLVAMRTDCVYEVRRPVYNEGDFQRVYSKIPQPPITIRESLKKTFSGLHPRVVCMSLCPIINWIRLYQIRRWIVPDIISGMSSGVIQILQGLTGAILSQIPPTQGICSGFSTSLIYVLMGTSQHVTIGVLASGDNQAVSFRYSTSRPGWFFCFLYLSLPRPSVSAHLERYLELFLVSCAVEFLAAPVLDSLLPGSYSILHVMMSDVLRTVNSRTLNATSPLQTSNFTSSEDILTRTASTTLCVGSLQCGLAVLQFGLLSPYMSDPLLSAFLFSTAILLIVSQISYIFGIVHSFYSGPMGIFYNLQSHISHIHQTNPTSSLIFLVTVILLWAGKYLRFNYRSVSYHIPMEFLLVIIFTAISNNIDLVKNSNVRVIGLVSSGLPWPVVPRVDIMPLVISDALSLAVVSYCILLATAKIYAERYGYSVSGNQELITLGVCNIVGSFFRTFTVSCAISSSIVQEKFGGRTQVASLISACIMLGVVLSLGHFFSTLPDAVLSAMVCVNMEPLLLNFLDIPHLWRQDKYDFAVWVFTCVSCILLGLDKGLVLSLCLSLFINTLRTRRVLILPLGQIPNTNIYQDFAECKQAQDIEGVKIFQCCSSLYFGNIENFRKSLFEKVNIQPEALSAARRRVLVKQKLSRHLLYEEQRERVGWCSLYRDRYVRRRPPSEPETSSYYFGLRPYNYGVWDYRSRYDDPSQPQLELDQEFDYCSPSMCTAQPEKYSDAHLGSPVESDPSLLIHTIILDLSMVHFMDCRAVCNFREACTTRKARRAELLQGKKFWAARIWLMINELEITVLLAGCQSSLLDDLERNHFFSAGIPRSALFISLHDAVSFTSSWKLRPRREISVESLSRSNRENLGLRRSVSDLDIRPRRYQPYFRASGSDIWDPRATLDLEPHTGHASHPKLYPKLYPKL